MIRCDLSNTGICGAMAFSSTSQFSIGAAGKRYRRQAPGLRPKRSSVARSWSSRHRPRPGEWSGMLDIDDDTELHIDEIIME